MVANRQEDPGDTVEEDCRDQQWEFDRQCCSSEDDGGMNWKPNLEFLAKDGRLGLPSPKQKTNHDINQIANDGTIFHQFLGEGLDRARGCDSHVDRTAARIADELQRLLAWNVDEQPRKWRECLPNRITLTLPFDSQTNSDGRTVLIKSVRTPGRHIVTFRD